MMNSSKHSFAFVLSCALVFVTAAGIGAYASDSYAQVVDTSDVPVAQAAAQTSETLEQLVAPIALYPDALVAQILAASTYPAEVVEAWRWMQGHPGLNGQELANAVNPQPWDPSVKALTQFPSVLDSMNRNLAWTSALGDAYVNEPEDVLNAVQMLRQRAQAAGSLQSTSEQTVTTQGQAIAIDPTEPDLVYVPEYDPWLVYGAPLAAYPGWVGVPGIYYAGPDLYFDLGLGAGLFAGFGWGWHDWGFDWRHRRMTYNHAPYISHSRTFANRHAPDQRRAQIDRGAAHFGPGPAQFGLGTGQIDRGATRLGQGDTRFNRSAAFDGRNPERGPAFDGRAGTPGNVGLHSGAFSGFDHGGTVNGFSSRGRSSFGGGMQAGGFRGGEMHAGAMSAGSMHAGGGFHGGGGGGGGGGGRGGGGGGGHR